MLEIRLYMYRIPLFTFHLHTGFSSHAIINHFHSKMSLSIPIPDKMVVFLISTPPNSVPFHNHNIVFSHQPNAGGVLQLGETHKIPE